MHLGKKNVFSILDTLENIVIYYVPFGLAAGKLRVKSETHFRQYILNMLSIHFDSGFISLFLIH